MYSIRYTNTLDALREITDKAEAEGRPLTADEAAQVASLEKTLEQCEASIPTTLPVQPGGWVQ